MHFYILMAFFKYQIVSVCYIGKYVCIDITFQVSFNKQVQIKKMLE